MRLKHYINEESNISKEDILSNCSEIISIYRKKNLFFYRGVKDYSNDVISRTPRTNRIPKDTHKKLHLIFNECLYNKFGWRPRTEGTFATSSPQLSKEYGKTFVFFPFNGFKYVWSPAVEDAYEYMQRNSGLPYQYIKLFEPSTKRGYWLNQEGEEDNIEKYHPHKLYKLFDFDTFDYTNDKVNELQYEVNFEIDGKHFSEEWRWFPDVSYEDYVQDYFTRLVRNYTDKNIEKCLESGEGHEIMFKCNKYYIIPYNMLVTFIMQELI